MATESPHWLTMRIIVSSFFRLLLIRSFLYLQVTRTCIKCQTSSNFGQIGPLTTDLAALERLKISHRLITGKWWFHASSFLFDRIIIKIAGNQDRHKSSVEFGFGPNQTTHFGVTCSWVTKISHLLTLSLWSQLANLEHILCVASLGLWKGCIRFWGRLTLAHWAQVSYRCPLGYLCFFFFFFLFFFCFVFVLFFLLLFFSSFLFIICEVFM